MCDLLNRGLRVLVGVGILCAAGPFRLAAESEGGTATLTGIVLDPEGKSVPNAAVTVKSDSKGVVRTTTSDASGHFSVASLPEGAYTVDVGAPGFTTVRRREVQLSAGKSEEIAVTLSVAPLSEHVTVLTDLPAAARTAPLQNSLTARQAQSEISGEFVRNFISPVADFSQVIQMTPSVFSFSPNGVGLGDTKTYFRGFKDGMYSVTFDGIPFQDTNDPTHHSWAFFPSQFIGGAVVVRSPGSAATIGPENFGGSMQLLSRNLDQEQHINGSVSYGSFATRLFDGSFDSGQFGGSRLLLDAHEMKSDGYQTFNYQKRDAGSAKYQYAWEKTTLTVFGAVIDVNSNTPDTKGPTRAQVAQYGDNYLMSSDPSQASYYGYNTYHIPTDFEYVGIRSNLGNGWTLDDKVYTYRYYNKQNFNSPTVISPTSGTDKLNSYRTVGNLLPISQVSSLGTLRTGLWSEYAMTDRYQTPQDPRTLVDAALPNFHEKFDTTLLQPFLEYEFKVTSNLRFTPGIKLSYYKQDFTQFADNGKTVGNLNGAPSITHAASYTTWLPSVDAHYRLQKNWSAYAQFATGDVIPPTNVFDVKGAQVGVLPKPTTTSSYQVGSVWKSDRATFDIDGYYTKFDNSYSSSYDPVAAQTFYFASGTAVSKGVEAESNIVVGGGVNLYLNGSAGTAKYSSTGKWIANAPQDTETVGLSYNRAGWSAGMFAKRVGKLYDDNKDIHEAVPIDPFTVANLFLNYTLKNQSRFSNQTRLRLSINNLFDKHSIVGVVPASATTSLASPNDIVYLLPARSIALTLTIGFSPRQTP